MLRRLLNTIIKDNELINVFCNMWLSLDSFTCIKISMRTCSFPKIAYHHVARNL